MIKTRLITRIDDDDDEVGGCRINAFEE